jgi:lysophospholipase L1-like esterase
MSILTRRTFLSVTTAGAATYALFARSRDVATPPELVWTDVADWPIEGRAFAERAAPYDRLPARAEGQVRAKVWELSRQSAGMVVRFQSNSPGLWVRYRLTSDRLAMPHMPATGVSGLDLYSHDGGGWRWVAVTRPSKRDVAARMFVNQPAEAARSFQLYLPLYNGVEKLELGVPKGFGLRPMPRRGEAAKPIVCYGTSIMHGACSSRPGMAWTSIMGRRLDREVMNFGFSGNGRMEVEVGQYLAELDPAAFVIDCLPNMNPKMVAERTQPLVRQLRAARPKTPILLVEDRTFTNAWFHKPRLAQHEQRRQALRGAFTALEADGVKGLHLLAGDGLLGADGEAATDGSHPSDLGMLRQANAVTAALRPLISS